MLRYRGVDIEELVGHYPYENVWGLLVDNDLTRRCPTRSRTSRRASRATRRPTSRPRPRASPGEWKLGKLNEISDEQAREDLGRLSAQMMEIVARSAARRRRTRASLRRRRRAGKDRRREVPAPLARRGRPEPREGDRHVLDLHRRARPERVDLHGAGRRLDRRRLRSGALLGRRRALRPAARRRPGVREADARGSRGDGRPGELGPGRARERQADHGLRPSRSTAPRIRGRGC